jgi:hypothetical protein
MPEGTRYTQYESAKFGPVYEIEIPIRQAAAKSTDNLHAAVEKCIGPAPVIRHRSWGAGLITHTPKNLFSIMRLPAQKNVQFQTTKQLKERNLSTWGSVAQSFPDVSSIVLLKKSFVDPKQENGDFGRINFVPKSTLAVLADGDSASRVRAVLLPADMTELSVTLVARLPRFATAGKDAACFDFENLLAIIKRNPTGPTADLAKTYNFQRVTGDPDVVWLNLDEVSPSQQTSSARELSESIRVTYDPFPSPYRDPPSPKPVPGR